VVANGLRGVHGRNTADLFRERVYRSHASGLESDHGFLFKGRSTCLEADGRIFGVRRVRIKKRKGFPGVNPEYPAMGMPGGISKRYPHEEKPMISPML